MAKIPLLADPAQLQNGNQTLKTAQLPAVTNQSLVKGVDAIAQVSEGIMMKSRRAKDLTAMTSLDLAKSKAQIEFAKFQQENQDEEKWLPKWEETVGIIQAQAGEMSLTPEARQAVTSDLSSWSTRGTITVQSEAFKQAGRNARLAVDTAIQVGDQTGDYTPARKAVRGLRENNLISPEEEENTLVGIDQKEGQLYQQNTETTLDNFAFSGDLQGIDLVLKDPLLSKHYSEQQIIALRNRYTEKAKSSIMENQAINQIAADPVGETARLEAQDKDGNFIAYPEMGRAQRAILIQKGQAFVKIEHNNIASNLQEQIVEGSIRSMKDLEKPENMALYSKLPPTYKAQIDQMLQEGPITDPGEYQKAVTRIEATDLTDGPEVASTQRYLKMFAPEEQKMLLERLDKRMTSSDKTPRSTADLFQEMDEDLSTGVFGDYRLTGEKVEIEDGTGRARFKTVDNNWYEVWKSNDQLTDIQLSEQDRLKIKTAANKSTVVVEDLTKKRTATQKLATLKEQVERKIADGESPAEARVWYLEQTKSPRLEEARKALLNANPILLPSPNAQSVQLTPSGLDTFISDKKAKANAK